MLPVLWKEKRDRDQLSEKEAAELLLKYLKENDSRFFKSKWDVKKMNRRYGTEIRPSTLAAGVRHLKKEGVLERISQDRFMVRRENVKKMALH